MSYETRFRAFAENACVEEKAARYDDKREAELTKRGEAAAFSRMIPDAKDADAQIAALTERLRAVEAERDEAKRETEAHDSCNDMFMAQARAELSALRAELQRRDAALRKAEQALFDHVAIEGDQASFALRAVRAALQPKEPPCQTA